MEWIRVHWGTNGRKRQLVGRKLIERGRKSLIVGRKLTLNGRKPSCSGHKLISQ